jgi:hypothetical protein
LLISVSLTKALAGSFENHLPIVESQSKATSLFSEADISVMLSFKEGIRGKEISCVYFEVPFLSF